MSVNVIAPAKINLGLEIKDKNPNGYHDVYMIMQSVSLYDELNIGISDDDSIKVTMDKSIDCAIENNIAYKSAKAFLKYVKADHIGLNINIKKNIPIFAGLAGGSADGAGVIVGLNKLLKIGLSDTDMCQIGEKIGADIPFCILGGTKYATGIGTNLKNMGSIPECFIVLVKPDISISTAEAYSKYDNLKIKVKNDMNNLKAAIYSQDLHGICNNLYNRFEEIVDDGDIYAIKRELKNSGALGALMTGSGSVVYGIFEDKFKAADCITNLKKTYAEVYLAQPLRHGAICI